MKRMRLARLRMKSLKRMNSMLGFTDEERARRVLLASVVSRTRDEAKASYVKSNPPPLDKSNEKFLADMHIPLNRKLRPPGLTLKQIDHSNSYH